MGKKIRPVRIFCLHLHGHSTHAPHTNENDTMMRILAIAALLATAATMMSCHGNDTKADDVQQDTIPMMVMQIKKCSKLYTTTCRVHKIVTHEDKLSLSGKFMRQSYSIDLPVGKRKIAIPMDATVKAYVDFADFGEDNIKKRGGKIEITLPDPHFAITSTRIDHKEVKQYVSMLRSDFSDDELTSYERQGRDAIAADIPNMGLAEAARLSAARTLIPMIEQMGYNESDITITFRKQFTKDDYRRLIEQTTVENGKKTE